MVTCDWWMVLRRACGNSPVTSHYSQHAGEERLLRFGSAVQLSPLPDEAAPRHHVFTHRLRLCDGAVAARSCGADGARAGDVREGGARDSERALREVPWRGEDEGGFRPDDTRGAAQGWQGRR